VGRLGSGVWVSVSFQIFALKVGEMSKVGMEIVRVGGKMYGGICPRWEFQG